jgi:hypothetical protein
LILLDSKNFRAIASFLFYMLHLNSNKELYMEVNSKIEIFDTLLTICHNFFVVNKFSIFWDITPPCIPLSVNPFHWFLAQFMFLTLKMGAICSFETSVDNGLQGVISQKMVLFITTAVRTSNPTRIL